jgi:hypothetical protein
LELVRVHCNGGPSPDQWSATLELVHGQVDSVSIQDAQGSLNSLLMDQPLQVAVLAAGKMQELQVRTRSVLVDRPEDESQEVGLAPVEALPDCPSGLLRTDGVPEERWEIPEQSGSDGDLPKRDS